MENPFNFITLPVARARVTMRRASKLRNRFFRSKARRMNGRVCLRDFLPFLAVARRVIVSCSFSLSLSLPLTKTRHCRSQQRIGKRGQGRRNTWRKFNEARLAPRTLSANATGARAEILFRRGESRISSIPVRPEERSFAHGRE